MKGATPEDLCYDYYWHVGLQSLSPYESTFKIMKFIREHEVDGEHHVFLEACVTHKAKHKLKNTLIFR